MSRHAVLEAWKPAWEEYLQIFKSDRKKLENKWKDWAKGRTTTDKDGVYDQIRITGGAFASGLARTENANDTEHCVKVLHVFVQFIVHEDNNNKIRGWDDCFKDIFSIQHFEFKKQWMTTLDAMVAYIQGLYPTPRSDDAALERFQKILRLNDTGWKRITDNIRRSKEQIQVEELKVAIQEPRTGRKNFRKSSNQALTEPHTLERMRGLLCDI
jgi:hypothetical protein